MGLDQYVFQRLYGKEKRENNDKDLQIFYWRKHHDLNSWICDNVVPDYMTDFNCEEINLSLENIDNLFYLVVNRELSEKFGDYEKTFRGSFYSQSSAEHYGEKDLEFIKKARDLLKLGKELYYYAWW